MGDLSVPGSGASVSGARRWSTWLLLALLLVAALVVRVGYHGERSVEPGVLHPTGDAGFQLYWARSLGPGLAELPGDAAGRDPEIGAQAYFRAPGYPFFLSALLRLVDGDASTVLAVQAALGVMTVLLAFLVVRRVLGPAEAVLAAGLLALDWSAVYYGARFLPPVLELPLALLLILAIHELAARHSVGRALALGLALGCVSLIRSGNLWLVPVALAWLTWKCRRGASAVMRPGLALLVGVTVIVLPVAVRNLRAGGEFVLVAADAGPRLLIGNHPGATGTFEPTTEALGRFDLGFGYPALLASLARVQEVPRLAPGAASRSLSRRAALHGLAEPAEWLRRTVRKAALLVGPYEIDPDRPLAADRSASGWLTGLPDTTAFLWAAALVGALGLARDRARAGIVPLLGLFAVGVLSKLATYVTTLERLTLLPLLVLFGAAGVLRILRLLGQRSWRPAGAWLVLLVAGALCFGRPWVSLQSDEPLGLRQRGIAALQVGDLDLAMTSFKEAAKMNPRDVVSLNGMGKVLMDQGRVEAALGMFDWVLEMDPEWATAHLNRGVALASLGRNDAASQALLRVVEIDPRHRQALTLLGITLERSGASRDAALFYARALAIEPEDFQAANNLAWFLATAPRSELRDGARAVELARSAVRMRPDDPAAFDTLAASLAEVGRFEEAVAALDRALQLAPETDPMVPSFLSRRAQFQDRRAYHTP